MAQETIFSPFKVKPANLTALTLINIEKDPDSIYIGFEPQLLQNKDGEGFLVLAYRFDKKVDIYFQPQLQLKVSDYAGIGKGGNQAKAVPFKNAYMRFSEKAYICRLRLRTSWDETSRLKLMSKTKPFGLLAPIGTGTENPDGLMLVFLEDFYFVRQTNTKAKVKIGNREHKLDTFMPMDGKNVFFTLFVPPAIVTVNPNFSGKVEALPIINGKAYDGENEYIIQQENDTAKIESIRQKVLDRTVTMAFSPAFPNIQNLKNGERVKGSFIISAHEKSGTVSGRYSAQNENGIIHLSMIPSGGWKPYSKNRFIVKMVFNMAKVFRRWPKTYEWNTTLIPIDNTTYEMKSDWKRITSPAPSPIPARK